MAWYTGRARGVVDQDARGGIAIKTTFEKVMEKRFWGPQLTSKVVKIAFNPFWQEGQFPM